MPIDQLRALVEADLGDWGRADLERVVGALGWRLGDDELHGRTPVEAAEPYQVRAYRRDSWDDRGWFGEFTTLRVERHGPAEGHADAHRDALDGVAAVLGAPGMIGGPDAFAQWRLADTIVGLSGHLRGVRGGGERSVLALTVEPREATENDAYQSAEWGEDWAPEYTWRADARDGAAGKSLLGMMSYPRRRARDWDELADNLHRTFATLVRDLPVLDAYGWDVTWRITAPGRDDYVQGYFSRQAREDRLDRVAVVHTGADFKRGDDVGTVFPHPTREDAGRVAELALAEIRSWGVTGPAALRHVAWMDPGYSLYELGLGLEWGDG